MAHKFGGDTKFNFGYYLDILNQNKLTLEMVHELEVRFISRLDADIFVQPTFSDVSRELAYLALETSYERLGFTTFLDNYMLYLLISVGCTPNVEYQFLAASLFFLETSHHRDVLDFLVGYIEVNHAIKPTFFKRFHDAVASLANHLVVLGIDPLIVKTVAVALEPQKLFV